MLLAPEILESAMNRACEEARKWLGATSPNPPVGAVALDETGAILAVAAHQKAGSAHAEAALIEQCRVSNALQRVHTLCVTLEPCAHYGRTPPCCEAILEAKIPCVAIGTADPNPDVLGGGIERLKATGVQVMTGIAQEKCRQLIYAFAHAVTAELPYVTVKRAFDATNCMIPPAGSKTFTSESSILFAHRLRKRADAILTGSGTILADNPLFTVRKTPDFSDKTRYLAILDRRGRVPSSWREQAKTRKFNPVVYAGIEEAFQDLAAKGARDILVEAGPGLSNAILETAYWVQQVTLRKGDPDTMETTFRSPETLPFDARLFAWENVLPAL